MASAVSLKLQKEIIYVPPSSKKPKPIQNMYSEPLYSFLHAETVKRSKINTCIYFHMKDSLFLKI